MPKPQTLHPQFQFTYPHPLKNAHIFGQELCSFTLEWHQLSWAGAISFWRFVCISFVSWSWNICPSEQCLWCPHFQKARISLRSSAVKADAEAPSDSPDFSFSSLSSLPELGSESILLVLYLTSFHLMDVKDLGFLSPHSFSRCWGVFGLHHFKVSLSWVSFLSLSH